jgi:isoquinoline 1-oxidoreductase subunit beta
VTGHYSPGGLPPGQLDPDAVEGAKEPPYEFPAIHVDWTRVDPPIPFTWWRGVGPTHNVFVVESFIDELAHSAQRDPLDYRKQLLGKNPRAKAVLELVAEKSNWGSPLPARRGRGVSLHDSFGSFLAVVVEVTVDQSGEIKIDKAVAAMDCGLTINPDQVKAQLEGGLNFGFTAALYSDITLKNGKVQQGNFNDYRMLRIHQSPAFEIHVVASTADPGGVGETGTVSAAPALGNAIFAATGVRLRRYPFDRGPLAVQNVAANSSADRTTGLAGGAR